MCISEYPYIVILTYQNSWYHIFTIHLNHTKSIHSPFFGLRHCSVPHDVHQKRRGETQLIAFAYGRRQAGGFHGGFDGGFYGGFMRFSHDFMGFDGIWWDFKKHHMGQKQGDFSCQHGCKKNAEKPAKMEISPRNMVLMTANVTLW